MAGGTQVTVFDTNMLLTRPYKRHVQPWDLAMHQQAKSMGLVIMPSIYVDMEDCYGLFTRRRFVQGESVVNLGKPTLTTGEVLSQMW